MTVERWRPFGSVSRWEPMGGLTNIQSEMNGLFDSFFGRSTGGSAMTERVWASAVDVYETKRRPGRFLRHPGCPREGSVGLHHR